MQLQVENIKCGGCANSIRSKLEPLVGCEISIDIESGIVNIDDANVDREQVVAELTRLGYPESGSVSGLDSAKAKAKSFVSCAVGRIQDDTSKD